MLCQLMDISSVTAFLAGKANANRCVYLCKRRSAVTNAVLQEKSGRPATARPKVPAVTESAATPTPHPSNPPAWLTVSPIFKANNTLP